VDFDVQIPKQNQLVARTVNGEIEALHLGSDVDADSVNGAVNLQTSGAAAAKTVNGNIHADLGALPAGGKETVFKTVNGSIHVELPATASVHVTARTVNGDAHSDFPITVQRRHGSVGLDGTIGSGSAALTLETVNGSIDLLRAP
jgi:DUF4097 and DUF4098 domain-containing protein YvlB